ncbi:hypothetical protein ACLKA6_005025 [Drosophila palustris]
MPGTFSKATTHVSSDNKHRRKTHKTFSLSDFHNHFGEKDGRKVKENFWKAKTKNQAENVTPVGAIKEVPKRAAQQSRQLAETQGCNGDKTQKTNLEESHKSRGIHAHSVAKELPGSTGCNVVKTAKECLESSIVRVASKSKESLKSVAEVPAESKELPKSPECNGIQPLKKSVCGSIAEVTPRSKELPKSSESNDIQKKTSPDNSQSAIIPHPLSPSTLNWDKLRLSRPGRGRGGRVRSCPRIPTPPRHVPHELQSVDSMTSADFRHDYGAHLENMRIRQKDQKHMQFFQTIIEDNKHLFVGRTILVLSCGTGTLALMAARAGATRVYAVDHSNVTDYAQLVVRENHYEDVITVLHGRVGDINRSKQLLVDGIVCNWMGHCLLYESELVQLLLARELWLKPDGFILPDLGALYLMGGSDQLLKNERCNWWLDVYGCKMNAMRRYSLAEPRYARIKGEQLLTLARKVMSLDLRTATLEDLQIDCEIRLQALHAGYLECFVLYFDVTFSRAHLRQKLSCNPWLGSHLKSLWLQTVLLVEQPFIMRPTHAYTGQLIFKPLKREQHLARLNLNEMKMEIELFEATEDGHYNPCVLKSWLMMPRFQTVQEVADCQDKQFRIDI